MFLCWQLRMIDGTNVLQQYPIDAESLLVDLASSHAKSTCALFSGCLLLYQYLLAYRKQLIRGELRGCSRLCVLNITS